MSPRSVFGGKCAMHVRVTDYDPRWADLFAREAAAIRAVLGENCVAVHHIGSTAVPGLAAKPVIDMMPVVHSLAAAYGALKRELAARFPEDIEGYCDGKDAFVRGLERRALAWEAERAAGR